MVDLKVSIGSLVLKNPVLTASGTFGYGTEFRGFFDVGRLGGIITKTITLRPRTGNPMPRLAETPAGMLNSIGLANVGVDRFLKEKLPRLTGLETAVIVNIAGETVEEYGVLAERIQPFERVDALEINISCPNVKKGGLAFGTDPEVTRDIVRAVRSTTVKPVIAKLTPNVTDIVAVARAAAEGGADALSLINTVLGMAVDVDIGKAILARCTGGLSGPAIKPIALAKVYQVRQALSVPIVGIGGIMSGRDALEFLMVGACAVQVGTFHFIHPDGSLRVLREIERFCIDRGISRITDWIGSLNI